MNQSVQELLLAALEIPQPELRAAFVAAACGQDLALRQELEELLQANAAAGRFLPDAPAEGIGKLLEGLEAHSGTDEGAGHLAEKPGDWIGRYKLLQNIGEGGWGVVYMAEQQEPVSRKVALKVIKLGMDTKAVVARFEAERQALALMDHPNIARVLDAGATATGRPYFVMELVRGVKITQYCDQQRLSTRQRLELFIQVCHAVQHAHQKGVIHRDLKPSNILVTERDGAPMPKVIDFGIAKAAGGMRLTDKTLFTAFEQFIGTPAYMSPEQARLGELDIDTRTDIYALGVLLYELLTGRTPFDSQELTAAGLEQLRRTIQDKQPPRPSTRLTGLGPAELADTGKCRGVEGAKLVHLVRGDLDWVIMKCLEKDRRRRYEAAIGLARDVQRHLSCEPVVARPPSRLYEFQKTVRRHRVGFAAAASVVAALSIGLLMSTVEVIRARRAEAARALLQSRAELEAQNARRAEAAAQENLRGAYLAQAQAWRLSGRSGRRFEALAALKKAAELRVGPDLRNEAVACLALPDVRVERSWPMPAEGGVVMYFDDAQERMALWQTNGHVRIVEVNTGRELLRVTTLAAPLRDSAIARFSPDGHFVAIRAGRQADEAEVWELNQQARADKAIARFDGRFCRTFSFSPDGRHVAIAFRERADRFPIEIYDLADKRMVSKFEPGTLPCWLGFHPSGRQLLTSSQESNEVLVWDYLKGQVVQRLPHPREVFECAWNPEGTLLATGCGDSSVYLWNATNGLITVPAAASLRSHDREVTGVSFSSDGAFLLSVGWDSKNVFWNPSTHEKIFETVQGPKRFSRSGLSLVSFGARKDTVRFAFEPARQCRLLGAGVLPQNARGRDCDFSSDGKWLLTAHTDGVRVWNSSSGELLSFHPESQQPFAVLEPGSDRCLISAAAGITEWELRSKNNGAGVDFAAPRTLSAERPLELTLSPDGITLSFFLNGQLHLLTLTNGEERALSGPYTTWVRWALSPDQQLAVSWGAPDMAQTPPITAVQVFELATTTLCKELPQYAAGFVDFSPDGKWLLVSDVLELRLYDRRSWVCVYAHPTWPKQIRHQAFSADSSLLALAYSDDTLQLVLPTTGAELVMLESPESRDVKQLTFSPDGCQLAVMYSSGTVRLWDLRLLRHDLAAMNLDW